MKVRGRNRLSTLGAFLVVALFFSPLLAVGSAQGQSTPTTGTTSVPVSVGGFLTYDRHFLVFNGITTFGGGYEVVYNGSQVYASQFVLVLYSLLPVTETVPIVLEENGVNQTTTTTVQPGVADLVDVSLYPTHSWTNVVLLVDGTPQVYSVSVPLSFLPNSIANVGGLDLLALAIISESLFCLALATSFAYGIMRKALWAPKFSLLVWGHVILFSIVGAVILDFQQVDQTFAGWSPLVYAFFLFPIFFLFALSFFNRAPSAEMLQANAPLAGRLRFNRWDLRIGRDLKGRWVLVGDRWSHFLFRAAGKQVPLTTSESTIIGPEPFMADIVNRRVVSKQQLLKRVRKLSPEKADALDDFDIINVTVDGRPVKSGRREPPVKLLFTPVGKPVEVEWPRLSVHKQKDVPDKFDKEGNLLVPAHKKTALCFPYITEGRANITLHTIHFRSAVSVVAGWRTADDLSLLVSDVQLDLESLKANVHTVVARKVREKLLARESLLMWGADDLPEDEAVLQSEREKHDLSLMELTKQFGAGVVPKSVLEPKRPRGESKPGA